MSQKTTQNMQKGMVINMFKINAIGLVCPLPVIKTKQAFSLGEKQVNVVVDNDTAVENLKRFAQSIGADCTVEPSGDNFSLTLTASEKTEASPTQSAIPGQFTASSMIMFGSDTLGDGERELGEQLMKMFFYSLTQSENPPTVIAFLNSGVRLATENREVIEHLKTLHSTGMDILVCGACLDYYKLPKELTVGIVSNMYEIQSRMLTATNTMVMG